MNKYIVYGLLAAILVVTLFGVRFNGAAMLGAEGDTNLTNLVLEGDLTVGDDITITGDLSVATTGTTSIGGGAAIDYITRDTFSWDSGLIPSGYTSSTAFLFDATPLPAVGDECIVGAGALSSSTEAITFTARITANNGTTASGTMNVVNRGLGADFGVNTISITCFNY